MIKPMLFNTDMVRAILDGRKTVTRRVVKPQKEEMRIGTYITGFNKKVIGACSSNGFVTVSPHQPGDILYVREAWSITDNLWNGMDMILYRADYNGNQYSNIRWRPSIHMPKEIVRIFLRVKDVRVERLQDITEKQAQAEGFYKGWKATEHSSMALTAKQAFMWTWDYTIKPADRIIYGWLPNPWVWVIEFERCEKPNECSH